MMPSAFRVGTACRKRLRTADLMVMSHASYPGYSIGDTGNLWLAKTLVITDFFLEQQLRDTCDVLCAIDPNSATVLPEIKAAGSYQRSGIVEKTGWATPLGAEIPTALSPRLAALN